MLCTLCRDLSISKLIELAEVEFSGCEFPAHAYYQHHSSYSELEKSAQAGCEFCLLICDGFKYIPISQGNPWAGRTRHSAIREIEGDGETSGIRIAINAEHVYGSWGIDRVRLFDTLMVQPGAGAAERGFGDEDGELDHWWIDPLLFTLSVGRGMSSGRSPGSSPWLVLTKS